MLCKVNAENILKFHNLHKSYATIGVVEYEEQNFGVIKSKNFKFQGISEKPIKNTLLAQEFTYLTLLFLSI